MKIACLFKYDHTVRSESWQHEALSVISNFFFVGNKKEIMQRIEDLKLDADNLTIKVLNTKVIDGVLTPDQEIYSWEKSGEESEDLDFWA
jgi:hypothetical protein